MVKRDRLSIDQFGATQKHELPLDVPKALALLSQPLGDGKQTLAELLPLFT